MRVLTRGKAKENKIRNCSKNGMLNKSSDLIRGCGRMLSSSSLQKGNIIGKELCKCLGFHLQDSLRKRQTRRYKKRVSIFFFLVKLKIYYTVCDLVVTAGTIKWICCFIGSQWKSLSIGITHLKVVFRKPEATHQMQTRSKQKSQQPKISGIYQ